MSANDTDPQALAGHTGSAKICSLTFTYPSSRHSLRWICSKALSCEIAMFAGSVACLAVE